jgi:hypothetical protein
MQGKDPRLFKKNGEYEVNYGHERRQGKYFLFTNKDKKIYRDKCLPEIEVWKVLGIRMLTGSHHFR